MSEIESAAEQERVPVARKTFYTKYGKRFLDIFLSSAALIALSPLLMLIALLILIYHGRPIMYNTVRSGRNGKPFLLYKFRSMTNKTDEQGKLLTNRDRLTKFGKLIRTTSIDELPGLFNILKGDMSVIGPRPLPAEYKERYSPRQRMRLSIRPGLTCVSMKKDYEFPTWESQFENDVWYIQNVSFWLDCKMIAKTLKTAVKKKNRSVRETGSRPQFTGVIEEMPQSENKVTGDAGNNG